MRKFISILLLLTLNAQASYFHNRYFCEYEYEDFLDFTRICDVAYGEREKGLYTSPFKEVLESKGWDITFYEKSPDDSIGVIATCGELCVAAYGGTLTSSHVATDLNITSVDIYPYFTDVKHVLAPEGAQGHKGFLERYSSFEEMRALQIVAGLDEDQTLIFAGHSMGGSMAILSLLDLTLNSKKVAGHTRLS